VPLDQPGMVVPVPAVSPKYQIVCQNATVPLIVKRRFTRAIRNASLTMCHVEPTPNASEALWDSHTPPIRGFPSPALPGLKV
jgi:hypothetical protein